MGFCNNRKKVLGDHAYQIAVYQDRKILKLFNTDVEFGVKVIEESARDYIGILKKTAPEEYRLVKFDNTKFNPLERVISSEVL